MFRSALLTTLAVGFTEAAQSLNEAGHCASDNNIFEVKVDIFAGNTGYFDFGACGRMPTLAMVANEIYTFQQFDATNWYHPLGFAYEPDGALAMVDELEPGVVPPNGDASCLPESCQSPQYQLDGVNLGLGGEDFGLDEYEGNYFSGGRDDFLDAGDFSVDVQIDDAATTEFFYFCHIHIGMSGRVVVYDDSETPRVTANPVEIPYTYDFDVGSGIDSFDEGCGTFNTSQFRDFCPQVFLCDDNEEITNPTSVDECFIAIDCAMHEEMRVNRNDDPMVTFINQMIPHHRNAVNMAKIMLTENPASMQWPTAYGDAGEMETMMWEIINNQNAQITLMQNWLRDNNFPRHASCFLPDEPNSAPKVGALGTAAGLFTVPFIAN
jgi:hypothetical protein